MSHWASLTLASYPGSVIMWGLKREPGDYCIAHAPKLPDFKEFVIALYSSVTDDIKLVSERLFVTMAVSVLCSSEFFYEL